MRGLKALRERLGARDPTAGIRIRVAPMNRFPALRNGGDRSPGLIRTRGQGRMVSALVRI